MMKVIGIAGGMGSGKSTVTDYLRKKSYTVLDADEIAREAVNPGEPALKKLTDFFGGCILLGDGSLNRRKLAQITFGDRDKTGKLNEILHEDIRIRLDGKLKAYEENLSSGGFGAAANPKTAHKVFISAPLFFEAGLEKKCHEVWTVVSNRELRIARAMKRDDISRTEVEDRINRQMTDEERARRADCVVCNDGTKEELFLQVDELLIG